MSWLARFRNVFRSGQVSDEIDREMAFHLTERADDLMAAGVPPDEAQREARRRFGSYVLQKENTRERDLLVWIESLFTDIRYGVRGLRRSPVFCLTAVLTLAIGIGANTAVFTLLYGLLLRNLPVTAPQELVRIGLVDLRHSQPAGSISYAMWEELRREPRSFVDLSAWRMANITVEERDGTMHWDRAGLVSGNAFELLGLRPRLGRLLGPSDDVPGGPVDGWPVVLSYGYWNEQFGGDPAVIGRPLTLGDTVATIVGVLPWSFRGVWQGVEAKFYVPMAYWAVLAQRDPFMEQLPQAPVATIGRLRPGVSLAQANAEIAVVQDRLLRELTTPDAAQRPLIDVARLSVESAQTGLPTFFGRSYSAPLRMMQGLVAIVLLLCCVNVSGLMLSKLHERQHEFAVRTAIGAPRMRLVRQFLTESFVIALGGASLGAVAAWHGSRALLPFFRDPNMGFGLDVQPDQAVFFTTAALAVLTTLAFGLAPAWRAGRTSPGTLLKARTAVQRQMAGRGFVAIQVAVSLVLVVLAALLSQSLLRLRGEAIGFDAEHVTIQTAPFHLLPQRGEAKLDLYQRMVDRIAQSPGIRSVALTWYTPMTGIQSSAKFQPSAGDGASTADEIALSLNAVGSGYFRTMATRILAGREFEPRERRRDVCVLNQSAAQALFPNRPALGEYVRNTTPVSTQRTLTPREFIQAVTCRVVGVAEDAKFANLREPPPRTIYFPLTPDLNDGNLVFLINAPTKAAAIAGYRPALREITPSVPLVLFVTLREQMDVHIGSQRAITLLSTFFGGVALLLSAIGLYGMLSASVTQRTGEIGVRVALGASRATIVRMIVSDALRLVAIGAGLGAIALVFTVHSIDHMLYGVSAFDPGTIVVTGGLLTIVILVAAFRPARRAASVDPISAMRAD